MKAAKVCAKTCQLLVVCGYIVTGLILSPFLLVAIALALPMWAGQKILACAKGEEELT